MLVCFLVCQRTSWLGTWWWSEEASQDSLLHGIWLDPTSSVCELWQLFNILRDSDRSPIICFVGLLEYPALMTDTATEVTLIEASNSCGGNIQVFNMNCVIAFYNASCFPADHCDGQVFG